MIKKPNKKTLSDKIASILTAAPDNFIEDDAIDQETSAKVLELDEHENNDLEQELLSKFRKQNVNLLEDVDEKYAGKKGSRKSLRDSESDSDFEQDASESENDDDASENDDVSENDDDASENGDDASENDDVSENDDDASENGDDASEIGDDASENDDDASENENESEINENSGTDESESDYDDSNLNIDEENDNFKHLDQSNIQKQVTKGLCVRNQMNIWENLLEIRIQLQKCLITSNKMPQVEKFQEIKAASGETFLNKVNESKTSLVKVLDKLMQLQELCLKKYPETKNLDTKKVKNEESDEEIPSDTEEEPSEDETQDEPSKKRRKLHEFAEDIKKNHEKYKPYRNEVIQKWNDKTRLVVAKNNTSQHSVTNQIDHILSDRSKLIKRTQLKRSEYSIVGQEIKQKNGDEPRFVEEYNTQIFDDDDFYHQLLRELIEVKSSSITDPVQLGRQWIQLQNLRSKMKRKVDTKATKGRKIRYAIHSKLVNFMAPYDKHSWTDEAKNELFSSLFGKNQTVAS